MSFTAETGSYQEVLKLVRTISGIPIILSPEARQVIADDAGEGSLFYPQDRHFTARAHAIAAGVIHAALLENRLLSRGSPPGPADMSHVGRNP